MLITRTYTRSGQCICLAIQAINTSHWNMVQALIQIYVERYKMVKKNKNKENKWNLVELKICDYIEAVLQYNLITGISTNPVCLRLCFSSALCGCIFSTYAATNTDHIRQIFYSIYTRSRSRRKETKGDRKEEWKEAGNRRTEGRND